MRKLILMIGLLFFSCITQSQTLKGFTIGSVYNGETKTEPNGKYNEASISTTLGGVDGVLTISVSSKKIIFGMSFLSNEIGSEFLLSHIVNGFKEKLNIDFTKEENGSYFSMMNGSVISIHLNDEGKLAVIIFNMDLAEKAIKDSLNLQNDDF